MLHTILDAIKDLQSDKPVVVVDDEARENEGDLIIPAQKITPEIINFMATHGRGLICVALTGERCDALNLHPMVQDNSALHETAFTVSVDLIGHGCTTGISAHDRARTVQALIDSTTKPEDLARPGHIFPLRAVNGGVLERPGHTEAAVELASLAGFEPAGVLVEIMHDDGSMARLPELKKVAERFDLKIISIDDLVQYQKYHK